MERMRSHPQRDLFAADALPEGLAYDTDFVSAAEEAELLGTETACNELF